MTERALKTAFEFPDIGKEFNDELLKLVGEQLDAARAQYISPHNNLSYSHGGKWLEDKGPDHIGESTFNKHEHETALQLSDVVAQKLHVLPMYVADIVSSLTKAFVASVFEKIEEVTDRTGNVVDAKAHPNPAMAFLAMLETIQFGVDRDGKVSRPSVHAGKQAIDAMRAALEAGGKEFEAKIDEITKRKEVEALERERQRKKRFKGLS